MDPLHAKIRRLAIKIPLQLEDCSYAQTLCLARREILGEELKKQKLSLHQLIDHLDASFDSTTYGLNQNVLTMLEDLNGAGASEKDLALEQKLIQLGLQLEIVDNGPNESPVDLAKHCQALIGESTAEPLFQKMTAIQHHLGGDVARPSHFLKEAATTLSLEASSKTLHQIADELCGVLGEDLQSHHEVSDLHSSRGQVSQSGNSSGYPNSSTAILPDASVASEGEQERVASPSLLNTMDQ